MYSRAGAWERESENRKKCKLLLSIYEGCRILGFIFYEVGPQVVKNRKNFEDPNRYKCCGHSVLMGRVKNNRQNRDYVLKWFGSKEDEAKKAYLQLVKSGLIMSRGGWSSVKALRLFSG